MSIAGWVSGVTTRPGAIALTRMPRGPSSSAVTSVSIERPAFAAQYGARPAPGWRALSDDSEMIEPPADEPLPGVLHHDERAGQADVDDPAPLGDVEVGDQAERRDAGAVDHDVEPAVRRRATPSRNAATDASSVTSTVGQVGDLDPPALGREPRSAIAAPMPDAPPKTTATRSDCSLM